MAVRAADVEKDGLLPELEMSLIPSKFSNNIKIDLFGLSDGFLSFLVFRGCIEDDVTSDTQYVPMDQAASFCKMIKDMYKIYKTQGVLRADI